MSRRTLLILGIIFAGLLGLSLLQNYLASRSQPQQEIVLERIFPEMTVLDIQAIRLQTPDGSREFTLNREVDGTWTAPGQEGALNAEAATAIARTIVLLPYQRTVPEVDNLSLYGFNPYGTLLIQVLLADGAQHGVAVGGLTPTGSSYYTLVDERLEVYLVERGPVDFLMNYLLSPPVYLTTPTPRDNLNNDGG